MTRKQNFMMFVQRYCTYLLADDPKLNPTESKLIKDCSLRFFKMSAPYECCTCGNRSGLSFIEKKHDCKNPMFDKNHIPIKSRVIEECDSLGLDFEKIKNSVKIKK